MAEQGVGGQGSEANSLGYPLAPSADDLSSDSTQKEPTGHENEDNGTRFHEFDPHDPRYFENSSSENKLPISISREFDEILDGIISLQSFSRENNILLSNYVLLSENLAKSNNYLYYKVAIRGLKCLRNEKFDISWQIWEDLYFKLSSSAALSEVLKGLVKFLVYAIIFCFLATYTLMFSYIYPDSLKFFSKTNELVSLNLVISIIFGCLGSVVSILLRLAEFEAMIGRSRQFLRYTGMSLPIIGGVFAAVIASLFEAKVINMSLGATVSNAALNPNLFILLGFLSGFSERFARGLLSSVESKISGAKN